MEKFDICNNFAHRGGSNTPVANLTYLAPPGQFFMGAKSLIGTPDMQIIFVLKDKLICTMKKCMVSMPTVNIII